MDRKTVHLSNIAEAGYDTRVQLLEIKFANGSVYQYFDVPEHTYNSLISCADAGAFLHAYIQGHYMFARIIA